MQCPRCGIDNDDTRAACWSCFAQLQLPAGVKQPKIEVKKPKAKKGKESVPVAVTPPVAPPVEVPPATVVRAAEEVVPAASPAAEAPAAESDFFLPGVPEPEPEPAGIGLPSLALEPQTREAVTETAEVEDKSATWDKAFDLDDSISPTDLIVPGLAYAPLPEEEEPPLDISGPAFDIRELGAEPPSDEPDGKSDNTA